QPPPRATPPPYTTLFRSFVPVNYTPGERIVFQANPTYGDWNVDEAGNPLPYLDGYTLTIADVDAALNLFLAGELDVFSPRNLDRSEEHTSELQSRENLVC